MFGWLKKKKPSQKEGEFSDFTEKTLKPMALATAITEIVSEYHDDIKNQIKSYPAHKRKNSNVQEIWADTRTEVLHQLFNQGSSDLLILADFRQQNKLLDYQTKNKLDHEPLNEPIHDTLYAVAKAYSHIEKIGTEAMDIETDSYNLNANNKTILDELNSQISILRSEWDEYETALRGSGKLPPMPKTLLDIMLEDITKKAKSIAITAIFGTEPGKMIGSLKERTKKDMEEEGKSNKEVDKQMQSFDNLLQRILTAKTPEALS